MKKLIWKTILTTVLSVLAALTLVWGIISLAAPSLLVKPFLNIGMKKVSAWYAASSYIRTHDLEDLASATEISIDAKNDKQVAYYGNIFVHRDGFDEYCAKRNEAGYKQYICGQVAVAYYTLGENDDAFKTAFFALGSTFEEHNAVDELAKRAMANKDTSLCTVIYHQLETYSFADSAYYDSLMGVLKSEANL